MYMYMYIQCMYNSVFPGIHKACRPNKPSVQTLPDVGMEECNGFDVARGSTQILSSRRALKSVWGEHCTI